MGRSRRIIWGRLSHGATPSCDCVQRFGMQRPLHSSDRSLEWRRLEGFLDAWFPPAARAAGVPASHLDDAERRLGVPLPPALRELYEQFGARADIWSRRRHDDLPVCRANGPGRRRRCREHDVAMRGRLRTLTVSLTDHPTSFGAGRLQEDPTLGMRDNRRAIEFYTRCDAERAIFREPWSGRAATVQP